MEVFKLLQKKWVPNTHHGWLPSHQSHSKTRLIQAEATSELFLTFIATTDRILRANWATRGQYQSPVLKNGSKTAPIKILHSMDPGCHRERLSWSKMPRIYSF